MSIYGLADCNNFFVSCERVFRPAFEGRPAVVLSSNDGCIVARSDEAKALGVKMAQPAFQAKDLIERHSIAVISGNLSFLKTYSAARVGPRRTTRATVSVVGPGGKIATVASTDMHKLNVGAVFFFSTVSAQRKRAARF